LESVQSRQVKIQQNQIWPQIESALNCLQSIGSFADDVNVICLLQDRTYRSAEWLVIIDN
jgi:hypothetical protein